MFTLGPELIYIIPAVLIAMTLHEYAHARVAVALGDYTPQRDGRLTLSPLAHVDPIGLAAFCLAGFGWAKPVQFNPFNFKNYRRGMLLVAFAGPAANILVAVVFAVLDACVEKFNIDSEILGQLLPIVVLYNVAFAVFNLLPIPPLDGSKILASVAPDLVADWIERLEPYGTYILLAIIFLDRNWGLNILNTMAKPIMDSISYILHGVLSLLF